MACQEIAHRRHRGKEAKETAVDDHSVPLLHLVGQRHGDQCNSRDEVANVEEEEKSEDGVGGSVDSRRLLVCPDRPQGGGEVPHGLHGQR